MTIFRILHIHTCIITVMLAKLKVQCRHLSGVYGKKQAFSVIAENVLKLKKKNANAATTAEGFVKRVLLISLKSTKRHVAKIPS